MEGRVNQYSILWAEDDADDRSFFQMAFDQIGSQFQCHFVKNGQEVLSYLEQMAQKHFLNLIVLDINMPVMDGITALTHIKADERFRSIPAVVVSTAQNSAVQDTLAQFNVGFRTKPDTIPDLVELVMDLFLLAGMNF